MRKLLGFGIGQNGKKIDECYRFNQKMAAFKIPAKVTQPK